MRRFLKLGIFLLVLLALAGHFLYSYWPRERPGMPEAGGLPARLVASGEYGACVWLPYPHQNLGALAGSLRDGSGYLAAVAREAEVPPPVLPSFGPFAVPPSREIVACSDFDGERFLLVARVYSGLAAVAKLAGKLAGNSWLTGGEIRETEGRRNEVEERVLHVQWRDGFWMVRSGPEPRLTGSGAGTPSRPVLGFLHLKQEASDFPPGDYVLTRQGGDLDLSLAGGAAVPEMPEGTGDAVLLAVAGPAWPASEPKPLAPAAMALYDIEGGLKLGPLGRLPGAAVFNPPGSRRWALPARGLAGLLAGNLPRGNSAGWSLVALDAASLARAEAFAPALSTLAPPDGQGTDGRLVLGIWLRPEPALRLITRMRTGLEKVPLVDRRQVRRWRDWETLLRPVASCERISLAATRSPSSFRLRLHGCN